MAYFEFFVNFYMIYSEIGKNVFLYYNKAGRPILDFLHTVFDSLFYVLLFITVLISFIYIFMSVSSLFSKRKTSEEKFLPEEAPTVTVQIPTYNEIVALRCAQKCLDFDYPAEKFDIIIGDDSNNPEISKRIDEFSATNPKVSVSRRGSNIGYKSGNLNYMLSQSKGDIIVVFDSDFMPKMDFLKRLVTPFIYDKELSGTQARWKFIDRNKNMVSLLGSTIVTVFHQICLPFISRKANISFLCGSAEAVRKKDLIEFGGWSTGSLTEDIEFSLKLIKKGKRIRYLDSLSCFGEVPYTAEDLNRQQMRWAYGVIHAFKSHFRELYSSNLTTFREKMLTSFFCSGYLLSFLLLLLFISGTLSFITHPPGPLNLVLFLSKMSINIILTSGVIVASIFALYKSKNMKKVVSMLVSSFSFGLLVTYYVNIGIFKAFMNRPMQWFMLNKAGNLKQSF